MPGRARWVYTRGVAVVARVWGDQRPRRGKDGTVSWTVILPVKRLGAAKSRLRGAVPGIDHEALVPAMAGYGFGGFDQ